LASTIAEKEKSIKSLGNLNMDLVQEMRLDIVILRLGLAILVLYFERDSSLIGLCINEMEKH
jgi:hypothetical protein